MNLYLLDLLDFIEEMYCISPYNMAFNPYVSGVLLVKEKVLLRFLNGRHPRA